MVLLGEAFYRVRPDVSTFSAELEAKMAAIKTGGAGGAGTALTGEFQNAASGVEQATTRIGADIERIPQRAGPATKEAGGLFTGLANLFSSKASEITGGTNLVTKSLGDLDKAGLGATSSLEGLGGGAGAGLLAGVAAEAAVLGGSALAAEHFGEQVFKLQSILGGTGESASRFNFALASEGVSSETAARSLVRFSKNLQDGKFDAASYGVEIARTAQGNIDAEGTLLNLADAMQRLGPGTQATTLAVTALGRGAVNLIPTLLQGRDAVEKLFAATPQGQLFTTEQARQAHDFGVELKQLKIDAESFATGLGKDVIPALSNIVELFHRGAQAGGGGGGFFSKLILNDIPVIAFGNALGQLGIKGAAAKGSLDVVDASTNTLGEDSQTTAEQVKTLTDQLNGMTSAAGKLVDEQQSVVTTQRAVKTTQDDLSKAQADYSALLRVGGADLDKQAQAVRDVRDATESLTQARRAERDAAQSQHEKELALAEARDTFGANSEEARKAEVELSDAKDQVGAAANQELDAQDRLTKAHKDQADASAGSAAAAQRLSDAQAKVTAASDQAQAAVYAAAAAAARYSDDLAAANGVALSANGSTLNLIASLEHQRDLLAPGNPLRKNLQAYIDQLQDLADKQAAVNTQIAQTNAQTSLSEQRGGPGSSSTPGERGGALQTVGPATVINIYPAQGQSSTQIAQSVDAAQGGAVGAAPTSHDPGLPAGR